MNLLQKDWIKIYQTIAYGIVCLLFSIVLALMTHNSTYFYGILSVGLFLSIYVYMIHLASIRFGWIGIFGLIGLWVYISHKIFYYGTIFKFVTILGLLLLISYYCIFPVIEILFIKKRRDCYLELDFSSSMKCIGQAVYNLLMYCVNIVTTFFEGLFNILRTVLNFILTIFSIGRL